ncbi:capsular polysaccharide biosynthesis protein [Vogesella indigofera]|uniref:capsular polysaccharide biosynthesis protein n=1 Tax=Vogesella indigofera TaxID=45465 RepID=UPI00234F4D72|nr:capsular polysaccharide biosynthesis protein [Vogesella indigofera]MDC7710843.1 capsular polysaccharide biosynthesis protein [Vogesella indigofera]
MLRGQVRVHWRLTAVSRDLTACIGWGLRRSGRRAAALAERLNVPCWQLEDGFLRSLDLGVNGTVPFSLVVDDLGIYYDATRPCRLEVLIAGIELDVLLRDQTHRALALIRRHQLSKYNHAPEVGMSPCSRAGRVLVIDQTRGDVSVRLGGADVETFRVMLQSAMKENPEAEIWVKTHPDVLAGKKRGYLINVPQNERIHLLAEDISPLSLLEQIDRVYVVTSQMGFEALMLNKPVVCFGLPWYAGWGLTDDRHPGMAALEQRRNVSRTLEDLFAAAYLQYARYIKPETGEPGTIFDVIHYLARQKAMNDASRGTLLCVGMSLWKRMVAKPFLALPSCSVRFVSSASALAKMNCPPDAHVVVWGAGREDVLQVANERGLPVLRMEDGFVRSVGLGSNLAPPLSLVVDDLGIYFDARSPSRLERILQEGQLSAEILVEAVDLRLQLLSARIGKYNVGGSRLSLPTNAGRVILVPGQVEDDASIRFGAPEINTNLALLQQVRQENPSAYILYKPHPDVVSGNRLGVVDAADAAVLADQVVAEVDIQDCLDCADEVHTMTSLTGFEALLRGKRVVCYGLPFYSGWGLTEDKLSLDGRRTRRLTLDELVAGALIEYPRYLHPEKRQFISAHMAVQLLIEQRERVGTGHLASRRPWLARQAGKLNYLLKAFW